MDDFAATFVPDSRESKKIAVAIQGIVAGTPAPEAVAALILNLTHIALACDTKEQAVAIVKTWGIALVDSVEINWDAKTARSVH